MHTGDKLFRRNRRQLLKSGETTLPSAVSDDTDMIIDHQPQMPSNQIAPTDTSKSDKQENRQPLRAEKPDHSEQLDDRSILRAMSVNKLLMHVSFFFVD